MIKGKVHKFGDDVNTDEIIPARYLNTSDAQELAAHVMEDADPEFSSKVKPGDIIGGGKNFGCGSSREHAPLAIKTAGVACVVAESFARIFFRNAVNIGLVVIEAPELAQVLETGDELQVDLESGSAVHKGAEFTVQSYPKELQEIIQAGGLVPYTRNRQQT